MVWVGGTIHRDGVRGKREQGREMFRKKPVVLLRHGKGKREPDFQKVMKIARRTAIDRAICTKERVISEVVRSERRILIIEPWGGEKKEGGHRGANRKGIKMTQVSRTNAHEKSPICLRTIREKTHPPHLTGGREGGEEDTRKKDN